MDKIDTEKRMTRRAAMLEECLAEMSPGAVRDIRRKMSDTAEQLHYSGDKGVAELIVQFARMVEARNWR